MYEVLKRAHELSLAFINTLPDRSVAPTAVLDDLRRSLGGPLSEEGEDATQVLDAMVSAAEPGIMGNAGGRFFGFVIGGALPVSVAADWMTSTWDQNAGLYVLSPAEAVIEDVAGEWMRELLGLPEGVSWGFVTGAQMANFTGLAAARNEVFRRAGWDVNALGLQSAPTVAVVVGEEVHATVMRALRYLGLGTENAKIVAADRQGRMIPAELERVLAKCSEPTIVCAQAGNVNSGSIDPIHEIATLTRAHGAWLHVDGAFGLWAGAVPHMRHLLRGIELADSWATDAHKWLNVPQDCGVVFVADRAAHKAAVGVDAAYLIKGDQRDAVDYVPEFSRRGRGFPVYAALRHLGRRGVADLVERCCRHARTVAERLAAHPHAEVLNEVVLNQVLVRFVPPSGNADDFTRSVIHRIQQDGTCWLGGSVWQGHAVMRFSVSNWSTTDADIDRTVAAIIRCVDEEIASMNLSR